MNEDRDLLNELDTLREEIAELQRFKQTITDQPLTYIPIPATKPKRLAWRKNFPVELLPKQPASVFHNRTLFWIPTRRNEDDRTVDISRVYGWRSPDGMFRIAHNRRGLPGWGWTEEGNHYALAVGRYSKGVLGMDYAINWSVKVECLEFGQPVAMLPHDLDTGFIPPIHAYGHDDGTSIAWLQVRNRLRKNNSEIVTVKAWKGKPYIARFYDEYTDPYWERLDKGVIVVRNGAVELDRYRLIRTIKPGVDFPRLETD